MRPEDHWPFIIERLKGILPAVRDEAAADDHNGGEAVEGGKLADGVNNNDSVVRDIIFP